MTDTRVQYAEILREQSGYVDVVAESPEFGGRDGLPEDRAQPIPRDRACTLDECARALGISHQRASQLEYNALRKLRRNPVVIVYLRSMAEELQRHRRGVYDEM